MNRRTGPDLSGPERTAEMGAPEGPENGVWTHRKDDDGIDLKI